MKIAVFGSGRLAQAGEEVIFIARGTVLPDFQEQVAEQTEFELITWLVIR
jgi:hypothetical protein